MLRRSNWRYPNLCSTSTSATACSCFCSLMPGHLLVPSLPADIAHDVLDAGVLLEPVHGQVLAVAGLLEAAVRHLLHRGPVGVDPDGAEIQLPGHPHGPPVIVGPDRGREPVLH